MKMKIPFIESSSAKCERLRKNDVLPILLFFMHHNGENLVGNRLLGQSFYEAITHIVQKTAKTNKELTAWRDLQELPLLTKAIEEHTELDGKFCDVFYYRLVEIFFEVEEKGDYREAFKMLGGVHLLCELFKHHDMTHSYPIARNCLSDHCSNIRCYYLRILQKLYEDDDDAKQYLYSDSHFMDILMDLLRRYRRNPRLPIVVGDIIKDLVYARRARSELELHLVYCLSELVIESGVSRLTCKLIDPLTSLVDRQSCNYFANTPGARDFITKLLMPDAYDKLVSEHDQNGCFDFPKCHPKIEIRDITAMKAICLMRSMSSSVSVKTLEYHCNKSLLKGALRLLDSQFELLVRISLGFLFTIYTRSKRLCYHLILMGIKKELVRLAGSPFPNDKSDYIRKTAEALLQLVKIDDVDDAQ